MTSPSAAVDIADIARRFGTPLYVFAAATIQRRVEFLRAGITYEPFELLYSVKAHAGVALLRFLRPLVGGVDACSPGDVAFALAAGCEPSRISYVGHSMTDAEIDAAVDRRVFFTADSPSQLDRFGRRAPGSAVGLRLNCGVTAGFHPHVQAGAAGAKFGLRADELSDALGIARQHGLRVTVLHGHIGSDILEAGPHLQLLDRLLAVAEAVSDVTSVNLGGGLGTPFSAGDPEYDVGELNRRASEQLARFEERSGRRLVLRLEPGAYLVRDAGTLLATVTEVRPAGAPSTDRLVAGTDSSFNHLVGSVLFGTEHPVTVAGREDEPATHRYDVVGNLMQAADVLARDRLLPELRPGDILVFHLCGAYAGCRATTFNERPRPAEVLVQDGQAFLIRRAETVDDLIAQQTL